MLLAKKKKKFEVTLQSAARIRNDCRCFLKDHFLKNHFNVSDMKDSNQSLCTIRFLFVLSHRISSGKKEENCIFPLKSDSSVI